MRYLFITPGICKICIINCEIFSKKLAVFLKIEKKRDSNDRYLIIQILPKNRMCLLFYR